VPEDLFDFINNYYPIQPVDWWKELEKGCRVKTKTIPTHYCCRVSTSGDSSSKALHRAQIEVKKFRLINDKTHCHVMPGLVRQYLLTTVCLYLWGFNPNQFCFCRNGDREIWGIHPRSWRIRQDLGFQVSRVAAVWQACSNTP